MFADPAQGGRRERQREQRRERPRVSAPEVTGTSSRLLFDVLAAVYSSLGFDAVADETFRDLVIARIVEPTSILDTGRVLIDLGRKSASDKTMRRTLNRAHKLGYRDQIATACFNHATTSGDVSLRLYDVTTLYFEAENQDALRKVGYSKNAASTPRSWSGCWSTGTGSAGDRLLRRRPGRDSHHRPDHQPVRRTSQPGPHGRRRRRRDALGQDADGPRPSRPCLRRRFLGQQGAHRPGLPFPLARGLLH